MPSRSRHALAVLLLVLLSACDNSSPPLDSPQGSSDIISLPISSLSASIDCEDAAAWVAENRDQVPVNLRDMRSAPIQIQKASYSVLTEDIQTELWTDHLESYRSFVDADKLNLLDRIIHHISESGVNNTDDSLINQGFLEDNFGDMATMMFSTLQVPESKLVSYSSLTYSGLYDLGSEDPGDCRCSVIQDYCYSSHCEATWRCHTTDSGCGTLWRQACNGLCGGGY